MGVVFVSVKIFAILRTQNSHYDIYNNSAAHHYTFNTPLFFHH